MNRAWIRVWPVVLLSAALAVTGAYPGCGSNSGDTGRPGASGDGVASGSLSGQMAGSAGAAGMANGSSTGQTAGGAGNSGTDTTGATGSAGTGGPGGSTDAGPVSPPADPSRTLLLDGWRIQSSAKVTDAGSVLATAGYQDAQWSAARVPSTVLAALVADGVYNDPYAGYNLRNIPAGNFTNSWWYRREFDLPPAAASDRVFLGFDGINYRANIWLNGQSVATEANTRGAYRTYLFDVTALIKRAGKNALAVEVFRPSPSDLAINWWDWAYSPPDLNMGLFQNVYVRQTGTVTVDDLRITTRVPSPAHADVTVTAVVANRLAQPAQATVSVVLDTRTAQQDVLLAANETKVVTFAPPQVASFAIDNPPLWWPVGLGSQELRTLAGKVSLGGVVSDQRTVRVGLREITSDTQTGSRLFKVNGQRIFLRGGGWASDLLLRWDPVRTATEIAYTQHLGLNMIRLEGKLDSDSFYDRADEAGIILLPGWMCCDIWQTQNLWTDETRMVAGASMQSQGARLRNHPSVAAFLIGSDLAPQADVTTIYVNALTSVDWPNPIINAASNQGNSGLKMTGPYDWVAPNYWLEDTGHGGAFGFNSETGPGAAIPELETLQAFLSAQELSDLWMNPGAKLFHAGTPGMSFDNLNVFQQALAQRMGPATSLQDWVLKAQLMNYEGERAEYEAYNARKYSRTTGLVHWLLNNSWPSLIWHLYDYSLVPAASYYGAKKANEPLHAMFGYTDRSIIVVNNRMAAESGLTVTARLFDIQGNSLSTQMLAVAQVAADGVANAGTVPAPAGVTGAYLLELELSRGANVVSTNTYWLSTRSDVVNYGASGFPSSPTSQFADLTALTKMPAAAVKASLAVSAAAGNTVVALTLQNTGTTAAAFVRARLHRAGDPSALAPVFWDDNYVTLRPGASRTLTATCATASLGTGKPVVDIAGVNVAPVAVAGP